MRQRGISSLSYLLIGIGFVAFLLFIPLPHYTVSKGWYSGPSMFVRMVGSYDKGAPIDQVYRTVADAIIKSPFDITCNTNQDCGDYTVVNQCRVYCANLSGDNAKVARELENNRVCDPSKWSRSTIDCSCVLGRCVSFTQ